MSFYEQAKANAWRNLEGSGPGQPKLRAVVDGDTERQHRERERRSRHWDPVAAGDTIVGSVRKVNVVPGERLRTGEDTPVLTLDTDHGRKDIWLARVALRSAFETERPAPGAVVAITYLGLRENAQGTHSYHNYELEIVAGNSIPAQVGPWLQAFRTMRNNGLRPAE